MVIFAFRRDDNPVMQKVLRDQVNYAIDQYRINGNYATLPTDQLETELKTIFSDGAYVWGKFIQKSLPKEEKKSEQQDTFFRIVNNFFSYYIRHFLLRSFFLCQQKSKC